MNITEDEAYKEMMLKYNFAMQRLETELNILLKEYEYKKGYNPVEHIKTRMKSLDSAINKLKDKNCEITVDNLIRKVYDMIGIRIVCSFLSDVYDIVDLIKGTDQFIIKRENDYISNPKDSGYRSYHLIVLVPIHLEKRTEYIETEIQIRTVAMDCWASLDHKLRYKFPKKIPKEIQIGLSECSKDINELDLKMQSLHDTLREYNS
ncbi:MAG: GTP pyrophosphokinase family protein [bacterium]|nr:GTP pyrophosphokinase family protein [bacterium]